MSNPYTKPSIANYNQNPPPDDGSTGSDNEISWNGIKAKLTDPIKDQIDAVSNNTFSAFAKRAFNAVSAISSSYTVVTADEGKLLSCSNTITITLPAAATAGDGFMVAVTNAGSGTVTVDADGAETINGVTTIALNPGGGGVFVSNGSAWGGLGGAIGTTAPKLPVKDHGTQGGSYSLDLSAAETHIIAFSANATLTISSSLTNDKALVAVKSGGNTITLSGINNSSPTLTATASKQDFMGLVKSFGKISCVAFVNGEATA